VILPKEFLGYLPKLLPTPQSGEKLLVVIDVRFVQLPQQLPHKFVEVVEGSDG
jgi:hypothetical protein